MNARTNLLAAVALTTALAGGAAAAMPAFGKSAASRSLDKTNRRYATVQIPFVADSDNSRPGYYAAATSGTIRVTNGGKLIYTMYQNRGSRSTAPAAPPQRLAQTFLSNRPIVPVPTEPTPLRVNVFAGRDPACWRSKVKTFDAISLGEVWPGVHVKLQVHAGGVETLYTLDPGASAQDIRVRVSRGWQLESGSDGRLIAESTAGKIFLTKPAAWQNINGVRKWIPVQYEVHGADYGFVLGPHEQGKPVLIDPSIESTYSSVASAIAVGPAGDVYVAGDASLPGSATAGAAQTTVTGGLDFLVVKLSADLSEIEAATYLGGSSNELLGDIAIDSSGNVYVAGTTYSVDFPGTAGGAQPTTPSNIPSKITMAVAKLDPTLSTLEQATYVGGGNQDEAAAVAVGPDGYLYLTGNTLSTNFPQTSGAAESTNSVSGDRIGVVAKLDPSLTSLVRVTYFGGSAATDGYVLPYAIAVAAGGDVYVTGITDSSVLPSTSGAAQIGSSNASGRGTGFVADISGDLTTIRRTTYLGGSGQGTLDPADLPSDLAIAVDGNVYVAGYTTSQDFPATAGGAEPSITEWLGGYTGFVAQFDASLATLKQSTYLGGGAEVTSVGFAADFAESIAIGSSGDVYVTGSTTGVNDIPGYTRVPYGDRYPADAYIAALSPDLSSVRSNYLGGSENDYAYDIAAATSGRLYVSGFSFSRDLPGVSGGAISEGTGGFVASLAPDLVGPMPIRLYLRAPTLVPLGSDYSYSLSVMNGTTSADATGTVVINTLPTEVAFVSASASQGSCSHSEATVTCDLGKVTADTEPTIEIAVTAPESPLKVTDSATITVDQGIDSNWAESDHPSVTTTVDTASTATGGSVSTVVNKPVSGVLSSKPSYPGQISRYQISSGPSHGSVKLTDSSSGAFTYTPNRAYSGSDEFGFTVSDSFGIRSDSAAENITIADIPPTAHGAALSTQEDVSVTAKLSASPAYAGQTIAFRITNPPSHGAVQMVSSSDGSFTYTPAAGFVGDDSFSFVATDGKADSSPATEKISVRATSSTGSSGGSKGRGDASAESTGGGGGTIGWMAAIWLLLLASCRNFRHQRPS